MRVARLKLDYEKPASADRVLRLAKRIKDLVEAMGLSPDSDDITVTISNRHLRSELTGRTAQGVLAIDQTSEMLSLAARTKGAIVGHAELAGACAGLVEEFSDDPPAILLPGRRKPIHLVHEDVARLRRAQASVAPPTVRYTNVTVISPVLRCGATEEGGRTCARISLGGRNVDLPVPEAALESFVDALKKREAKFRIAVALAFQSSVEGARLVPGESKALRIVDEIVPTSGFQFLTHAKNVVRFDEEDG